MKEIKIIAERLKFHFFLDFIVRKLGALDMMDFSIHATVLLSAAEWQTQQRTDTKAETSLFDKPLSNKHNTTQKDGGQNTTKVNRYEW